MRYDWVSGTATGGSGNLVVSSASPYSAWTEAFGTSSTPISCEYIIGDGAGNYEEGYGMWTGSTATLARSQVVRTRTSGGTIGTGTPLTFSGTVTVSIDPTSRSFPNVLPGINVPLQNSALTPRYEWVTSALSPVTATQSLTTGNTGSGSRGDYFIPFLWLGGRPIQRAGIIVTTSPGASQTARAGIYSMNMDGTLNLAASTAGDTPGQPGALITEFTSTTQFDISTTGLKSVTLSTPLYLPPGWYWACLAVSSAATLAAINNSSHPHRRSNAR